jgi:hypothetical protein
MTAQAAQHTASAYCESIDLAIRSLQSEKGLPVRRPPQAGGSVITLDLLLHLAGEGIPDQDKAGVHPVCYSQMLPIRRPGQGSNGPVDLLVKQMNLAILLRIHDGDDR